MKEATIISVYVMDFINDKYFQMVIFEGRLYGYLKTELKSGGEAGYSFVRFCEETIKRIRGVDITTNIDFNIAFHSDGEISVVRNWGPDAVDGKTIDYLLAHHVMPLKDMI